MRILVFDTETSGLDPQWNVILQLSYQIVDSDSWTVQKTVNHYFSWPENKARVSSDAIKVNGLTEEVLKDKLDTKVKIKDSKLIISFENVADLNRILEIINLGDL